jgi:hypothetical protein
MTYIPGQNVGLGLISIVSIFVKMPTICTHPKPASSVSGTFSSCETLIHIQALLPPVVIQIIYKDSGVCKLQYELKHSASERNILCLIKAMQHRHLSRSNELSSFPSQSSCPRLTSHTTIPPKLSLFALTIRQFVSRKLST